jgi:hypothetical protein
VLTPERTTTTTSTGEIINKTVMVPLVRPVQESTASTSQTTLDTPFEEIPVMDDPNDFEMPKRKNNVIFFFDFHESKEVTQNITCRRNALIYNNMSIV